MSDRASYYEQYWQAGLIGDSPHLAWKIQLVRRLLAELGPKTVLDVGAGDGRVLGSCAPPGARAVGTDIAEDALTKLRARGFEGARVDLENDALPFEDGSFDVVTCLDVLEHIFTPQRILREIRRVVTADGRVIACVPNAFNLVNRLAYATGRHHDVMDVAHHDSKELFSEHIRFFSVDLFERFLAEGHLAVESRHYYFPETFTDVKVPKWATKLITGPRLHERLPSLFALGFLFVCRPT